MSDEQENPQPGEQQTGETATHFAWFRAFLEMGPSRDLLNAYRTFKGDNRGQQGTTEAIKNVPGSWRRAADKWMWRNRALLWDLEQSEARMKSQRARESELAEQIFSGVARSIDIAERADRVSELVLKSPLYTATSEDGKTAFMPADWNFNTGLRALLAAATSRRSAAQLLDQLDKMRCKRLAQDFCATRMDLEQAPTIAEQRAFQNAVLDRLEEIALNEALAGVDGAADRVLRIHKRAAQLNGLDLPFDPRSVPQPTKKRRDLSALTDEELAEIERITEKLESNDEIE